MDNSPQRLEGIIGTVQTAASGSFSAAARVLNLTPAAVSKNVAGLEQSLGVRLFNRTTRTLSLTEEGRRFVEQAQKGLDALHAASDGLTSKQKSPEGLVRISLGVGFGKRHVLPLLPSFTALYPKVQVELNLNDRAVDLVREGFDIGIRGGSTPPPGMVARKICDLPSVLVASRGYLQRNPMPLSVADLSAHQAVGTRFQSGQYAAWEFRQGRQQISFVPPARVWLSDPEATMEAARQGLGITQIGLYHAWPYLHSGELVPLLMGCHVSGDRSMAVFYPHRAGLAPRVRVLLDFLMQGLAKDASLNAKLDDVKRLIASQAQASLSSLRKRSASASTKRAS